MKEDIGQFAYRAGMKVKITPKTKLYDENYDRIFRKNKINNGMVDCDECNECKYFWKECISYMSRVDQIGCYKKVMEKISKEDKNE